MKSREGLSAVGVPGPNLRRNAAQIRAWHYSADLGISKVGSPKVQFAIDNRPYIMFNYLDSHKQNLNIRGLNCAIIYCELYCYILLYFSSVVIRSQSLKVD